MKTKAEIYKDSHPGRIVVETDFRLKEAIKGCPWCEVGCHRPSLDRPSLMAFRSGAP